ncbi:hypothetical protein SISSUDRAFT_1098835, partial [Sistotremastrum suecicum HHB10207 ss-3]
MGSVDLFMWQHVFVLELLLRLVFPLTKSGAIFSANFRSRLPSSTVTATRSYNVESVCIRSLAKQCHSAATYKSSEMDSECSGPNMSSKTACDV